MKQLFIVLLSFVFINHGHAQAIPFTPCKIVFMNPRQYAYVYRDVDSMKTVLNAALARNDIAELKTRFVQIERGFYKDSANVRYYFNRDKAPWNNGINGKILKTIP